LAAAGWSWIGPILLALLGGWLHEGFPRRLGAGMAVSFGGVLVVGISESDGGRTSVTGVVLCLVAAVCYAAGVVCLKLVLPCPGRPGPRVRLLHQHNHGCSTALQKSTLNCGNSKMNSHAVEQP
jgi:hypothetical protein